MFCSCVHELQLCGILPLEIIILESTITEWCPEAASAASFFVGPGWSLFPLLKYLKVHYFGCSTRGDSSELSKPCPRSLFWKWRSCQRWRIKPGMIEDWLVKHKLVNVVHACLTWFKQQRWSHCGYIQAVRVRLIIQQLVETSSAATSCSDSFLHRSLSPLQSFGPLVFIALLQLIQVCIHILWRSHHSVAVRWRSGPSQHFDPLHWASFTNRVNAQICTWIVLKKVSHLHQWFVDFSHLNLFVFDEHT